MSKILNGILIGLAVPVTAIGTACAVPQSREYLADKIAELASPKYAETLDLNKTQQTTIEELQEKQTELSNKLTNLQNEYDSLNSKLSSVQLDLTNALNEKAAIENELTSTKQSIATLNANIATLSSQKATLLDAITEIDNSINNTEDETEIENLEEKKQSILQQIEVLNDEINNLQAENATLTTNQQTLESQMSSLNTTILDLRSQVATLEVDKASLEVQISTLESEKAELQKQVNSCVTLDYTYYRLSCLLSTLSVNQSDLNKTLYTRKSAASAKTSSSSYLVSKINSLDITYNGVTKPFSHDEFYTFKDFEITFQQNGQEIVEDTYNAILENLGSNYIYLEYKVNFDESYNVKLILNLVDCPLSGKYVAENDKYIDFTEKTTSLYSNVYVDVERIYFDYNDKGRYDLTIYNNGYYTYTLCFGDTIDTLYINDICYTKVVPDTSTSDDLFTLQPSYTYVGDNESTVITFDTNNNTGTFVITLSGGSGTYTFSYARKDNLLTCTIDETNAVFTMELTSNSTLLYAGETLTAS